MSWDSHPDLLPTPLLLHGLNFGILSTCSPASNLGLPEIDLFFSISTHTAGSSAEAEVCQKQ